MALAQYFWGVHVTDQAGNSRPFGVGTLRPVNMAAVDGRTFERDYSIATSTTQEIFNVTNDLGTFDYIEIVSDQSSCYLELTTDQNGSVGDEFYTVELIAGVPFVLFGDASYANYTSNFGGGTLDTIERIRLRNLSGSTAKVSVAALT